jgi:hemerythrin
MSPPERSSALGLGHKEIDEQHKRLRLLAADVLEPLMRSAHNKPDAAALQALADFAKEHFASEESLMRSAGYPEADRHVQYHATLLADLRTYCDKMQHEKINKSVPVGLTSFLYNWLFVHINSEDRDLVRWLKAHEPDRHA